jgi:hypothetical protein
VYFDGTRDDGIILSNVQIIESINESKEFFFPVSNHAPFLVTRSRAVPDVTMIKD